MSVLRWLVLVLAAAAGCSGPAAVRTSDPLTDFRNPALGVPQRLEALNDAWAAYERGSADTRETREALKAIAWSAEAPVPLRIESLRRLIEDPDPAGAADARTAARLMVPREKRLEIVGFLGEQAARRGWTEMTPALVRSYSRPGTGPDDARPERAALLALNPGRSVSEIAFSVFLDPVPEGLRDDDPGERFGIDYAQRTRADAWTLLARLDGDGALRAALLRQSAPSTPDNERLLGDLRACLRSLATIPLTGEELTWLASLRDPRRPQNARWWEESAAAISTLRADAWRGLRLRHAEPIRWAAAHRAEWLALSREELLGELRARLAGRSTYRRTAKAREADPLPRERLADWEERLAWADLIGILAIDTVLADPEVRRRLFEHAREDRQDRTTEYGGLLMATGERPTALLFPPRSAQRLGDQQFVASSDMIDQGDLSLAHYHLHVQKTANAAFAGPSGGDLAYAERYGRNCLVFTSIRKGEMNVDYYQPGGAVIDMGVIRQP